MNLTTDVKSRIILFRDKSTLYISEQQANMIYQQSSGGNKGLLINGNYYSFADITKIMAVSDYYEQYPEKIPLSRETTNVPDKIPYKSAEAQGLASERRRQQMISGITSFITQAEYRGENPIHAKAILKRWQDYKISVRENTEKGYYQKVVDKYKDKERTESEEEHYQHAVKKLQEFKILINS